MVPVVSAGILRVWVDLPMAICSHPGCPTIVPHRGTCLAHRTPDRRPTASARGYGAKWRRNRARYLRAHPDCTLCPQPATVADHWPLTRRQLLDLGEQHPDGWHHLRPLCQRCHAIQTAKHDGSFGRDPTPIADRLNPDDDRAAAGDSGPKGEG
jgi:5-methylcytosine-specific restriction protein A